MPNNCRFPNEDRPFFTCHPWLTALLLIFGLGLFALTTYSVLSSQPALCPGPTPGGPFFGWR